MQQCVASLVASALLVAAFGPVLANTGGTTETKETDRLEPNAPGWPRTFGVGMHTAPGDGGRMFTIARGSIKIDCRSNGSFVWTIRADTEWEAGQTGDDWGDTTFVAGDDSSGTISGNNAAIAASPSATEATGRS